MKRFVVIFAVVGLIVATSGCSIREVQLWFQVHQHQSITSDQAKTIADQVNAKRPPGCDPFYSAAGATGSTCVPDNVASVHCAGTSGDGPSVTGPLKVGLYDPFNLDADGDKSACVDPVGSIDELGQVLESHVVLIGWALDPNTTDPVHVTVTDNGVATDHVAGDTRADLAPVYPGAGLAHGFSLNLDLTAGPQTHRICVDAKNVGAGADVRLGCKTITLQPMGQDAPAGHDVFGVIEGADQVAGGIRIRGYAFDDGTATLPTVGYGSAESPTTITSLAGLQTMTRPDVVSAFSQTAGGTYGFDFVQPETGAFAASSSVCLYDSTGTASNVQLMCRPINS